ncbi:MAG: YebC/PmpR family DNA-binding transcriptional regulator [Spirochaetaceae bacterium]|jgi:YebC/PmpR family DNA-binding regulatory protein|nr:YebC/PmpR family DNA-binding transcriptional regulator [Spirochaetaceae bacterium]GMO14684.1 MAG: YebC/PmpR family DNA-binding transcriptional regulator [Termitinemataceae bacterium]
MSGHSKWAKIKRAKGAADAQRGNLFTKLIKEISIAARMGGGDPEGNPRLRTAIIKARGANMPKDNIDRAIKKGTGELEGISYEELTYEARLGEAAILIEVLTDNRNRAAANVRNILTRAGAELAKAGSVSRLLTRKGIITLDGEKYGEDEIMEAALDGGADDVALSDGVIEVTAAPEDFEGVAKALESKNYETTSAEISMVPEAPVILDADVTRKVLRLIEKLEEDDDVQNVYSNIEVPDGFEDE